MSAPGQNHNNPNINSGGGEKQNQQMDSILNTAEVDQNIYMQLMNANQSRQQPGNLPHAPPQQLFQHPSTPDSAISALSTGSQNSKRTVPLHPQADSPASIQARLTPPLPKIGATNAAGAAPNVVQNPSNIMNYQNQVSNNPIYAASNLQNVSNPIVNNPMMQNYNQPKPATLLQQVISSQQQQPMKFVPQTIPNFQYQMNYNANPGQSMPQQMVHPNTYSSPQINTNTEQQVKKQDVSDSQVSVVECMNLFQRINASVTPKTPNVTIKQLIQSLIRGTLKLEEFVDEIKHHPQVDPDNLISFLKTNLPAMIKHTNKLNEQQQQQNLNKQTNVIQSQNQNQFMNINGQNAPKSNNFFNQINEQQQQQQRISSTPTQSPFLPPPAARQSATPHIPNVPNISLDRLQRIILSITAKTDIQEVSDEVPKIIAHALHLKLTQLINKLYLTTYHRLMTKKIPIIEDESKFEVKEVENPKQLISILNNISENDQRFVDAHNFLNMLKSGNEKTFKEMLPLKSQSSQVMGSQAAVEAERQKEANKTAMAALSNLVKRQRSDTLTLSDEKAVDKPLPSTYKSTKKDLIYVLEHEKMSLMSLALYQAYLS